VFTATSAAAHTHMTARAHARATIRDRQ